MPTIVAITFNPIIRYHYQRHLGNHKPKMVALMACMKKLSLMAQAILISQQPFNPNRKPLT
jgi:transposase